MNYQFIHGHTFLHVTCWQNNYEITKYLLENGANPNIIANEDMEFRTPLHCTLFGKSKSMIDLLLEYNAKVYFIQKNIRRIIELNYEPLISSVIHYKTITIEYLLMFFRVRPLLVNKRIQVLWSIGNLPLDIIHYITEWILK